MAGRCHHCVGKSFESLLHRVSSVKWVGNCTTMFLQPFSTKRSQAVMAFTIS